MAKPLDAEKCMAHARECVRLAGLTDDQEIRDQLIALAHDWIVAARKEEGEGEGEEDDDDNKVLVFPSHARNRAELRKETKKTVPPPWMPFVMLLQLFFPSRI
jgi:phosphopantothenoylcysteine synthetase/decarboxylase